MKRIIILILSVLMLISLFAACSDEKNDGDDTSSKSVSDSEESVGDSFSGETSENVVFDPTPRELEYSYKLLNVKVMPDEMRGYTVLSIEKFKPLIIASRDDLYELIEWMGDNNADSDAAMYFNALPDNYFDEKTLLVTDYTDFAYNERSVSSVYANENGVTVIYSTVFNGSELIEVDPVPDFMVVELLKKDILGCESFNAIADIYDNSIAELEENREILYYNGDYDFENSPERSETGVFEQYTDTPNPLSEYFGSNESSNDVFFLVGLDIDCEDETLVSHKLRQSGFIASPLKYYPEESSRFSYVGFIKKSGYEALSENESFSTGITWLSNSTNVSDDPDEPDTPDEPDEPDVPDEPVEYDPTPRDLEYTDKIIPAMFNGDSKHSIVGNETPTPIVIKSFDDVDALLSNVSVKQSEKLVEYLNDLPPSFFSEKIILVNDFTHEMDYTDCGVIGVRADENGVTVKYTYKLPSSGQPSLPAEYPCVCVTELDKSDVLGCDSFNAEVEVIDPDA